MRTIPILVILMLLTVQSAIAVWDASTEIIEVGEGDIVTLEGNIQVRIVEVGEAEEIVFVQVEKEGSLIGVGAATKNNPYTIEDRLYISMKGLANYKKGGSIAKIQIFQWVDGRFTGLHFPDEMNLKSLYNVFALVENTGTKSGVFTIELTQAGDYIRRADRYEDEYGNLLPRLVDVQKPIKESVLSPGETKKVVYENIAPIRRQPSGSNALHRSGDMLFNLYHKGQLLDQLVINDVKLTTLQSGYIQDVRMPTTFRRDSPQVLEIDILNAGPAFGGMERSKFNLRMNNDDFYFLDSNREFRTTSIQISPEIIRGDLPAYIAKTWKLRINTFAPPGDYNLQFILEYDREEMDRFTVPITVESGARTRISDIRLPKRVDMGEEFQVEVDVYNSGLGRDIVVSLVGDMVEVPIEKSLNIGIEETKTITFEVPALGIGIERLDARVLIRGLEDKTKNFDPYTDDDYEIHSKATSLYVYAPGMEFETEVETEVETMPETEIIVDPIVSTVPSAQPKTDMPEWNLTQGMPIMVVALVILAILITVKVLFYYAE